MVIDMNTTRLETIGQVREFLAGVCDVELHVVQDEAERRRFVERTLRWFGYFRRSRGERGLLFAYVQRVSGYSRAHVIRLIAQYRESGTLEQRERGTRTQFPRRYTDEDVALLVELDSLHDTLSGAATRALARRACQVYGDARYERLSHISVSHLYNLRAGQAYRQRRLTWTKTRPSPVQIAVRKAPAPEGLPGYIRIDTVHQGDQDGVKGVYHVNAVDIVTQWEVVAAVERISEAYLLPVIALMLQSFPFVVRGFHSDGGSEYINRDVAGLLEKLRIEFTRSRPRQTNDNALAECKNGAVVRKLIGYGHIPQRHAAAINRFHEQALNPYLNFHRPCYFAVDTVDARGRIRKSYPSERIMTPWDRLRSIPDFEQYLKPGVTAQTLSDTAMAMTDSQAAQQLQDMRRNLFASFRRKRA
ncbi:integrase catalytic domain-containing protein [Trinickia acidisoli]|uniref:integrase catalytic domain-containing protein n=1 Tax=Trinickia acidisoli TaxID=2767482 RepID=UPI001A8CCBD5|nr:DDE-type integrase/transposase/recombinase [Trinickia acidisoli]